MTTQKNTTQELQCFLAYFWTQEGWSGTRVELVHEDVNDLYNCCVVTLVGLFYSVRSQLFCQLPADRSVVLISVLVSWVIY